MKKLLIALFTALLLVGCANNPYKIDPVATANAPWKVGEKILENEVCYEERCYREFLGVIESGQVLVQDFYLSGNKHTDPFLVLSFEGAVKSQNDDSLLSEIDGVFIAWYENGNKMAEIIVQEGRPEGMGTFWHENGQKWSQGNYQNGEFVGVWREWDENGNFIQELDFSAPAN